MNQVQSPLTLIHSINWAKGQGLIPAIIQHVNTSEVLMLGYMNDTALTQTLETGYVTFWSRSKNRLWTKGKTSGNYLQLKHINLDCDKDTLLIQVDPMGETCHLGTRTCFGDDAYQSDLVFIRQLEHILATRRTADPTTSYTASLYAKGTKRIAQKVGEEGVEVALAATSGDKIELINETSDLIYHLLVLLQDQDLSLHDIANHLKKRHQA